MINITSGQSKKDRISFESGKESVTAIRKSNGKIKFEYGKEVVSLKEFIFLILQIFVIPSLVKIFVLLPLIQRKIIGIIWYLVPTFFYLFITIIAIIALRKDGGKEFLRNHGAEHMVQRAYEKLKRIPTVEEAKSFSRIHRACGVTIFSAFITAQLIGFVVYICTSYVIPEIMLLLVPLLFQTIVPFNTIGKIVQFFTTSKPLNHNIKLAIAALSELERINEQNTFNVNSNLIEELTEDFFK